MPKYIIQNGGGNDDNIIITTKKRIIKDYYKGSVLGKGGFGTAVLCQKETENNANYVIKILDLEPPLRKFLTSSDPEKPPPKNPAKIYEDIRNEIWILELLRPHCEKYIMCYIKTFIKRYKVFIICEYLENYDTLDKFNNMKTVSDDDYYNISTYESLGKIFKQLQLGLEHIHKLNVYHRDIKLANIMYNKLTHDIKYIDFGMSIAFIENICTSTVNTVGTPNYLASNILLGKDVKANTFY